MGDVMSGFRGLTERLVTVTLLPVVVFAAGLSLTVALVVARPVPEAIEGAEADAS
jgi:hypothetical protein